MKTKDIYPLTIIKDRYMGAYSGGNFTAWNLNFNHLPEDIDDGDMECSLFWQKFPEMEIKNEWGEKVFVGLGNTPDEALQNLASKIK